MATSLKEYLKKYTGEDNEDKKRKKKKTKAKPDAAGVLVFDEDPIWQKPVKIDDEEDNSADEEKPQVDEDIEVKRMKRLELLRSKRPFGAPSEDGSGWVSVSNLPDDVKSEDRNSDISPPRRRRSRNDTPSPRSIEQPDVPPYADLSPPRKRDGQKARYDTPSPDPYLETSQPDRVATDLSPPRRRRREKHDLSPEQKLKSSNPRFMDLDISPPRRSSRDTEYKDGRRASSRARDRSESNLSSRKSDRVFSDHDTAPSVSDLSPPRRQKGSPLMVDHPKTGLVSGKDIKQEIDKTKKEDWFRFRQMEPSVSGRDAEAIYRNKITGERVSKEEFIKSKEKKKEEKPKEIKLEWGKGLAQKREAEARLQEIEVEKDMPFARTRDDPNLDKMLKERVRWGDPMAHLVKNKNLDPVLPDLGDSDKMKESGFIIPQEIPSHSWIRRGLDPAPNRYGIKPGRHWDGVDRSTGYEKGLFKRTNEKKATEREAYLWSVSDM